MSERASSSIQRVADALQRLGLAYQIIEFAQTTRSALDAARAIGCQVGQIAKSLIFRGKRSQEPVLVIASGANRVDESKLGELLGEPVERPDADYVRLRTGFVIGGVPPVGHSESLRTFIDEDLLQYAEIWAAAGTPNAVFKLAPADLLRVTGGCVIRVH